MRNWLLAGWDTSAEFFSDARCVRLAFRSSYIAEAFGSGFSQLLMIPLVEFSIAATKTVRFRLSAAVGLPLCRCSDWGPRGCEDFGVCLCLGVLNIDSARPSSCA